MDTESAGGAPERRSSSRAAARSLTAEGAVVPAASRLDRLRRSGAPSRLGAGLGWLGIGLGLLELAAPQTVARLIGVEQPWKRRTSRSARRADGSSFTIRLVLRGIGIRELASGIAVLTRPRPATWLWSRVAGDLMDLSLLGLALSSRWGRRGRLSGTAAAVLGITALDVLSSLEFTRVRRRSRRSSWVTGQTASAGASAVRQRPPTGWAAG